MLDWLQRWYKDHCDGDWEHEYGVLIQNIDNPGWMVTIDLSYTELSGLKIPHTLNDFSEEHWLAYSIEDNKFIASGDPDRLDEILRLFKQIWESNAKIAKWPKNL
jgi:hypothetical protein